MLSVLHNYLNTSSYYSINYCSLCALFRVLVSIHKALGIDSTDSVVFCVTRAVVSEREQETCCSPELVRTQTDYLCDSSFKLPALHYYNVTYCNILCL